ncbi:hypothetical protein ES708_32755 [subsurface metagenome]
MRPEIEQYFKKNYDKDIILADYETKNYGFDIIASNQNINLLIEYKSRFFETGENDKFLKKYDVLIELIQSLPIFQKLPLNIFNQNINELTDSHKVNIAIGWFYKCIADRLVFFRFLVRI